MAERNKLPRILCLKGRLEIRQLLKHGRRQAGDYSVCVWERSDRFKYGVFVSGRSGMAVRRNRLKRLFREAIRLNRKRLGHPVRIGFLPKRSIGKPEFKLIDADVRRVFESVNATQK